MGKHKHSAKTASTLSTATSKPTKSRTVVVVVVVVVAVVAVVVFVVVVVCCCCCCCGGEENSPILYLTTPDRPPLRLLC